MAKAKSGKHLPGQPALLSLQQHCLFDLHFELLVVAEGGEGVCHGPQLGQHGQPGRLGHALRQAQRLETIHDRQGPGDLQARRFSLADSGRSGASVSGDQGNSSSVS